MSNFNKVHTRRNFPQREQKMRAYFCFLGKGDINVLVWASLKLFILREICTFSLYYFAYDILEIQYLIFPYIR
jgi:hypothetical protein